MRRHPSLQDLSREHHGALKLALQAKRAALSPDQSTVQNVGAQCATTFALELEPHFLTEERDFLPLLMAHGEVDLAQRLQGDHSELRRLSARLTQPCSEDLLAFATLLTAHVRFEEREMFAVLERHLDTPAA